MMKLKKFTFSFVTAVTFIFALPFTVKAENGEPIGEFLKDRNSIAVQNEEAEEVFQEFLEDISFIVTDDSWTNILEIKGKFGLSEDAYNNAIPDRTDKIPYENLTDFDCMVYNYTYCTFAVTKKGSENRWETYTKDRDALAYLYQDFLNFKPTEGNDREAVNAAFEKIWDWQYAYIQEYNEPFDFIDQLAYSDMFHDSEIESSDTESLSTQDQKEIESALDELSESDKKEIQQAIDEEINTESNNQSEKSSIGIIIPILLVSVIIIFVSVFLLGKKKGGNSKK